MTAKMAVELIGGLGLFLFGMSIMSEALQRVAGEKLRSFLRTLTTNRFAGIFTGLTITAIIQSSSATTVMLVGFVNAGLLDLTHAIGVIMGANIGTTVTGWLVTLIGFKIQISMMALPAIGIGFFVRFAGRQKLTDWGTVLLGFGLLFLGLTFMKDSVQDLRQSSEIMDWLSSMQVTGVATYFLAVLVGALCTMVIQSSSASMALTMAIAYQGLIDFPTAAALLLGQNIGTTVTANLAAIGASKAAKQTARAHMLFNVAGVFLVLPVFWVFLDMIEWMVPGEVLGSTLAQCPYITDHMAAFHTIFNIANTIVFLPFVGLLSSVSKRLVWDKDDEEEPRRTPLKFIHSDWVHMPGLEMEEARQTLNYMGKRVGKGIDILMDLLTDPDDKDFERKSNKILSIEQEMDDIEEELTHFIVQLSQARISSEVSQEIQYVSSSAHDFERIGDHLRTLLALVERKKRKGYVFSEKATGDLRKLAGDAHAIVELVSEGIIHVNEDLLSQAYKLESGIDAQRKAMRKEHIKRLTNLDCTPKAGILFIEVLTSFEKIGDHAFNVAQDFSPTTYEPEQVGD